MNLIEYIKEAIQHKIEGQQGSSTTQVATTGGSFEKSGKKLSKDIPPDGKVLNYGAGLDHTTESLKKGLGGSQSVHDYEPFPERRKEAPTFSKSDEVPRDHYHGVVCHNVLNVVEPHIRDHIVRHIFSSMKEGGHAHIITRKFKGDVDGAKNATPGDEKGSLWIHKKSKGKTQSVYQKGFDGNELHEYIRKEAEKHGHKVEVSNLGFGASGVHVKMIKKNKDE